MPRLINPDERADDRDDIDDPYEEFGEPVGVVRAFVRRVIDRVGAWLAGECEMGGGGK